MEYVTIRTIFFYFYILFHYLFLLYFIILFSLHDLVVNEFRERKHTTKA